MGVANATFLAAGRYHNCAVVGAGSVQCWGKNDVGQLGDGTATQDIVKTPATVSGVTNAVAVAAGVEHTCALLKDGTINCWGSNYAGKLGSGDAVNSALPVAVTSVAGAVAVVAGGDHTCAMLSGGRVPCWGSNPFGQLGNGNTTNSFVAVTVTGF